MENKRQKTSALAIPPIQLNQWVIRPQFVSTDAVGCCQSGWRQIIDIFYRVLFLLSAKKGSFYFIYFMEMEKQLYLVSQPNESVALTKSGSDNTREKEKRVHKFSVDFSKKWLLHVCGIHCSTLHFNRQ